MCMYVYVYVYVCIYVYIFIYVYILDNTGTLRVGSNEVVQRRRECRADLPRPKPEYTHDTYQLCVSGGLRLATPEKGNRP